MDGIDVDDGTGNRIAHGEAWIDLETVAVTLVGDLPVVETAMHALRDQHEQTADR